MCYKASQTKESIESEIFISAQGKSKNYNPLQRSFHFNAFGNPPINIIAQDNPTEIIEGTWGLVPFWGKKNPEAFLQDKKYTLNARGEDFWETKSYKPYVQEGRCLMIFDGFFEPHHYNSKQRQPYYCYITETNNFEDRRAFSIAGIYSKVDDEYYVSLVTTEANDFFAEIHNNKKRMPLVLDKNLAHEWIAKNQSKSVIDDLVREGFTSEQFSAHPVSNNIYKNDFHRDGKEVIEPVEPLEELTLL